MKPITSSKVPAWTLVVAAVLLLLSIGSACFYASENRALKEAIRTQEALIPGFLEQTSILSPAAACRRNLFVRLKDRLIGSDSCAQGF